jgi:hypothetical protein
MPGESGCPKVLTSSARMENHLPNTLSAYENQRYGMQSKFLYVHQEEA